MTHVWPTHLYRFQILLVLHWSISILLWKYVTSFRSSMILLHAILSFKLNQRKAKDQGRAELYQRLKINGAFSAHVIPHTKETFGYCADLVELFTSCLLLQVSLEVKLVYIVHIRMTCIRALCQQNSITAVITACMDEASSGRNKHSVNTCMYVSFNCTLYELWSAEWDPHWNIMTALQWHSLGFLRFFFSTLQWIIPTHTALYCARSCGGRFYVAFILYHKDQVLYFCWVWCKFRAVVFIHLQHKTLHKLN